MFRSSIASLRAPLRTGAMTLIFLGVSTLAIAQGAPSTHEGPRPNQPAQASAHGAAPHGEAHGEQGSHEHAEHDEKAPPPPINWWHGLLGEKADVAPDLLYRAPGEPPPFLATLINFAVLVFVVVRFGRAPLAASLLKRKESILREIEEAAKLRSAAEGRLRQYEAKMEKISEELERVRREFRQQGERDQERIVAEAKQRRDLMQKDAALLLEQESKQLRKDLIAEVVEEAARRATELLARGMTLGDHDKFAESFLTQIRAGGGPTGRTLAGKGGAS